LVLVSPIPFENLNTPNLPDGEERNRWLSTYADVMAGVARRNRIPFVDLFYTMEERYEESDAPLTINGIHLNSAGNEAAAEIIVEELFGEFEREHVERIRAAVLEKNWCWF